MKAKTLKTVAMALAGAITCSIIGGAIGYKLGESNVNTSGNLTKYLNIGNFTSNGMTLAYAEEETVTDLTNTTWYIPAGWQCDAGFGRYDNIRYMVQPEIYVGEMVSFYMGYGGGNFDDVFSEPGTNVIIMLPLAYKIYSSESFTINFIGGEDCTNSKLISWLTTYGTQLKVTDLTDTTWKLNDTVDRLGQVEYDIQGLAVFEDKTFNCEFVNLIGSDNGNIFKDGDCEVDIILSVPDDDYSSGFAGILLNPDGRIIYCAYEGGDYIVPTTLNKSLIGPSKISTITITGGTDVTNTTLITWLQENGTLTKAEEPEETPAVKRLTATVSPENAVNAILDWNLSWKNASSTWANGKTVTDYVTVTPTSDGALTADVECKQAFGEQIIITANVRGYVNIKATCTVDYREKVTGSSFYLECEDPINNEESLVIWNFNQSSSDTYVDFIPTLLEYGDTFDDIWSQTTFLYASASSIKSVGTLTSEIQSYTISVAATQEYLNAFTFGGYSVTSNPEVYKNLITAAPDSDLRIAFTDILFTNFVSDLNNTTADMLNNFLSYLHEYSNSVMLRMKISCTALEGSNTVRYDTVYNLRFNSSSTENKILVTSVSGLEALEF